MSAEARLVVSDLRVVVTGTGADVVDEVAFSLDAGETLGLVGESGSGKTTVALALLGHARRGLTIDSGTVIADGIDLLVAIGSVDAVRSAKVVRGSGFHRRRTDRNTRVIGP